MDTWFILSIRRVVLKTELSLARTTNMQHNFRYEFLLDNENSRWDHWDFLLSYSFRPHGGPGIDSASNRNEFQRCLLRVKAAGAWN